MTKPPTMNHEEILRSKLHALQIEHSDLDTAIHAMEVTRTDALALKRLKKKKLGLKDEISRIEDELTPDIIA